jgi:hypothetical protein
MCVRFVAASAKFCHKSITLQKSIYTDDIESKFNNTHTIIFVFKSQQCLGERATIVRYTFIVYHVPVS